MIFNRMYLTGIDLVLLILSSGSKQLKIDREFREATFVIKMNLIV